MKRCLGIGLALLVGAACSQNTPLSTSALPASTVPGLSSPAISARSASPAVPRNFRAHLSGDAVLPPLPVPTQAEGQAVFQLSPDETELSMKVIASNIENVFAAHIHLGPVDARGPQVVFVLAPLPFGGRSDGVLLDVTITAANLSGPLAGQPLSALIAAFDAGNAYVDVPTNDFMAPPNTGPGDYPGGELRGQVR